VCGAEARFLHTVLHALVTIILVLSAYIVTIRYVHPDALSIACFPCAPQTGRHMLRKDERAKKE